MLEKQRIDEEVMTKEAEVLDEVEDEHELELEDNLFEDNPYVSECLNAKQQPVPLTNINPISKVNHPNQRDEVLSAAFKVLHSQQVNIFQRLLGRIC